MNLSHHPLAVCLLQLLIVFWMAGNKAVIAQPAERSGSHQDLTWFPAADGSLQTIETSADWQRRRRAILDGMQRAMGPLPSRDHLPEFDVQVVNEQPGKGYVRRTITFAAEGDDRIPADLYIPMGTASGDRHPAMLALHPTGPLGKRIVAGEGPLLNRQYAVELAQRGYVVVAPDYPSFGDYATYDFNADEYVSGTMKGITNHMRCVDLLQSLDEVDGDRIGVIGHSLGGHNAMFVAAFDPRLKVIVSSCGFTRFHKDDLPSWTGERYMPRIASEYGNDADRMPFDFAEIVGSFAPRAFMACAATRDDDFDITGVQDVIESASGVYRLYGAGDKLRGVYPDSPHDFPPAARATAYEFVDRELKTEGLQE